ncbi:hypothetical protein RhiirA4_474378 [Rhizophagus irregularis]|uniref:Uncharacterized protein n=1 Tax=Rhizophagus irregularis TaxID=588596 RepID=A0A2I1H8C3_9GLOM|nr:hypothetical protein RhiirA4_474378 [Rhizophagus irregularis]
MVRREDRLERQTRKRQVAGSKRPNERRNDDYKDGGSVRIHETIAERDEDEVHKNYQNHKKLESDWIFQEPERNGRSKEKKLTKDKIPPSTPRQQSEPETPSTPQAREYRGLGNLGTRLNISKLIPPKVFGNKEVAIPTLLKTPKEDEVVDAINKWRLRDEPPHDQLDDHIEKGKQPEVLKKDNLAPEEVVEVIKDYRSGKSSYTRMSASPNMKEVQEKMTKIKQIFEANYQEMEWTIIQGETIKEMREKTQIFEKEEFKNWMLQEANYLIVAKKIIVRTENHGLFQEFTEMNEDFSKRLEDENRY